MFKKEQIKYLKHPVIILIAIFFSVSIYNDVKIFYKSEIPPGQFLKILDSKEEVILVDIRDETEYEVSKIKNAINLPFKSIVLNKYIIRNKEVKKNKKIIIICNTGFKSRRVGNTFAKIGYTNIHTLIGGFEKLRLGHSEYINLNKKGEIKWN